VIVPTALRSGFSGKLVRNNPSVPKDSGTNPTTYGLYIGMKKKAAYR
jgi:hypothetical protein